MSIAPWACRKSQSRSANGCAPVLLPCAEKNSARHEQAQPASLLQPEGIYGPAFLTTKNYFVIKEYNFSDLYVLFVGHLADRMTSPLAFATPWSASTQLRTADVEAMQRGLTRIGLYADKIDGKAGMQTRAALGAYQKWPASRWIAGRARRCCARSARRAERTSKKNPAEASAGF